MKAYDPKKIEKKWQAAWKKSDMYEAADTGAQSKKPKFYGLIEFPYPSGDGLHVGHVRSNTAMDIISRKRRMEGFNVLYPIGWDAFGLPTENYALKTGIAPQKVTKTNTDNFRRQLQSMGFSFDWSREVNTTDPAYYKWTQWIFLEMWKKGLAYKKKTQVNWCPKDKIVLANEEVVNGCCERCGTPVEKREKEQWMLAITKYADRLDKDLDTVDYLEKIKIQQRNWIGRSEGAEIEFTLDFKKNPADNDRRGSDGKSAHLTVFTTRADTLFGVTYLVLAPEHPWVTLAIDASHDVLLNKEEVKKYVEAAKKRSEIERTDAKKDKTGVELKGVKAINPATQDEIPIFVADYVLAQYGTGAIMAVPAHDERDWEFATKYNLPIKEVIEPLFKKIGGEDGVRENAPFKKRDAAVAVVKHWSEDKYLCLKWKKTDWRGFVIGGIEPGEEPGQAAVREVAEETGYTSAKCIRNLGGIVNAQFYHAVKNENRWARFHPVYLELIDGARKEMADEEKQIHDVVWMSKGEVDAFLGWVTDMRLIWRRALYPDTYGGGSALHESSRVTEEGLLAESGKFSGMNAEEAKKKIVEAVGGKIVTTYKLRDWIFSRQRYWGEPIPLVHCEKCGWVAVPEKDLPLKLPPVKKYQPTDTGESPLASDDPAMVKWRSVRCPQCKGPATRETDTMPQWAGSSWYFLRYIDPKNKKALADAEKLKHWQPVDWYNGGMEHTTLHLLYSRFWNKFLFDIGVAPTSEPYAKRTSQGLILAGDGEKMSKSRGNVVNPDTVIGQFGADTLRVYEMFMGPFDQAVAWSTDGIVGPRRFLEKIWRIKEKVNKSSTKTENREVESAVQKTIKKVSVDIEAMQFNTAVSAMMILANEMDNSAAVSVESFEFFLKILAPFAPHISEDLWSQLGHKKSIHLEPWPTVDESKIQQEAVTIMVQVNGKVRGHFQAASSITEADARNQALGLESVKKWLEGKEPKKIIYVPGRLVSIVIA